MKKTLVKLVALSATAMSLAAVATPAVNAYYKDANGVEYQTLVNVSQEQYAKLLPEISNKIIDVKGKLPAQEAAVKKAEAAKKELANAEQALKDLTAIYGEYTKKVQALAEETQRAIDLAEQTRATELAEAQAIAEPARIAMEAAATAKANADKAYNDAVAAGTFSQADLDALAQTAAAAGTALTEATNVHASKVIERDNAIAAAHSKADGAISAANAAHTTKMADLNREYNVSDVYGVDAKIKEANDRLAAAEKAVTKTSEDVLSTRAELDEATKALDEATKNLTAAKIKVAEEKANLADLYNTKAYLEANLHELVVGSKANSTDPSRLNLNKEQQEIVKDITGKDSKDLQDAYDKTKAELDKLVKERDEMRKEAEKETPAPADPKDPAKPSDDMKDGSKEAAEPAAKGGEKLPETGEASDSVIFGAAALSILAGLGLVAPKFKKEN
ncbi:LPXTG cell wall anchor domain-containing protein [Eremococcus coleocola]|uniref:LPXTG cell wall anchor domain-containing protein n=1 Tax=Eremococcus coleocola TaxID=88132 RepID=UPI00040D42B2|nr:LPXTG cell wall anchor domain-containing protein [Eremococcus coleocola]